MTELVDSSSTSDMASGSSSDMQAASTPPVSARVTPEQLEAAAVVTARAFASETPPPRAFEAEYDRLRKHLEDLWSAPVRDMEAIDATMVQLDEAHASFKAQHATEDHQRY